MTTRTLTAAAAFAASAALLLTACGGGSGKGSDKINGAQTGSPSASSSPSTSANRPTITIPAGFTMDFEGWTSSDPTANAILQDGKERMRSVNAAIMDDDPSAAAFAFYSTDSALSTGQQYIKGFTQKSLTVTGTVRYTNPQITVTNDHSAVLRFCDDESKGFAKERKTGKVLVTPVNADSYALYSTKLSRNARGVWQTVAVATQNGKCQP